MHLRSSVLCLFLIAVVVMIGALPIAGVKGAVSDVPVTVFSSPIFISLLLWLCCACLACCWRGGFSFRRTGFLLTHLGVVVLLGGAILGGMVERKMGVVAMVGEDAKTAMLPLSSFDQEINLPFSISVPSLQPIPEYILYLPDETLPGGYRIAGRYIPSLKGIDLGDDDGVIDVERLQPDGRSWVPRISLESGAVLQQNRSADMYCRCSLHVEKRGEPTIDEMLEHAQIREIYGVRIQLDGLEWVSESDAIVTFKIQKPGQELWESVYIRPGEHEKRKTLALSHLTLPFSVAVKEFRVAYFDPSYSLFSPPLSLEGEYIYVGSFTPDASGLDIGGGTNLPLARIRPEGGDWVEQIILDNQSMLRRNAAGEKYYEATVVIYDNRAGGATKEETHTMAVNRPVSYDGWRFYLINYDRQNPSPRFLNITARYDPGRNVVILGIWMLMLGTFIICLLGKEKRYAV